MSAKTIFIIILTVLVTIVLMKNTDEVVFWIFGERYVPKLAVLGTMFAFGLIVGLLLSRSRRKPKALTNESSTATPAVDSTDPNDEYTSPYRSNLSDEDRKYID